MDTHNRTLYGIFSFAFFLLMVGYWLMRPLKMGIFIALVGLNEEPNAKIGSVIVMVPLLFIYNKMISVISIRNTVYIVLIAYAVLYLVM